ncbi:tRNA(fMet)-specific endonuclease VapC [Rhizobium sp. SG_E_25_P2]|uniref:type II toxin-antitoxin system VapC family toxin n=1 Tax=Rhizobium sp. SG_E_25_P2 TaxID=2879942 RepID=UPI00247616A1|nr:type II toxin-antitoxin system VapC family toxin [Rhizobium sp. SG_E_25_P2]MDH6266854.1 tRNA(fMet)-specific endonuclease VapC [Rhizobium sp. SG_E_25_P2]
MLDTNIVSDMVRNPRGATVRRARDIGQDALCVSVVTACELRFGALKKGSPALMQRVGGFLSEVPPLPFETAFDGEFARIRVELEMLGRPISPFDLLIAAHAKSLDLTLVTDNIREFSRIDGLKLENWIERPSA